MNSIAFFSTILALVALSQGGVDILGRRPPPRPYPSQDGTLVLVHTLFRHGNRTPDYGGWASNPWYNESFYWPYGYGQLTDEGKRTEFKIGTTLRQRYNNFLGDIYSIYNLDARTTNTNRTKMSLELMLAGLWPPARSQRWNRQLNWQPIPYNYLTSDKELQGTNICENFDTLYNEALDNLTADGLFDSYQSVYAYLSNNTALNITTPGGVFNLYFIMTTIKEFGYPLDEWTKPVFPEIMEKITKDVYYLSTNTTALKKLAGGYLLKKIINDSKAKIDGLLTPQSRKMFVYSAHEKNVAVFLATLGVYPDDIPPYGSHVLVELHLIDGVYGFKVFYQDWLQRNPKLLTIPGCDSFCPYDDFVSLLADVIPEDSDCEVSS